jgi:hypothetical protein
MYNLMSYSVIKSSFFKMKSMIQHEVTWLKSSKFVTVLHSTPEHLEVSNIKLASQLHK